MTTEWFEQCHDRIENIAHDAAQEIMTEHGVTVGPISLYTSTNPIDCPTSEIIGHIDGDIEPSVARHSTYITTQTPHPCELVHDYRTNAVARLWKLGVVASSRSTALRHMLKRELIKAMHHKKAAPAYSDRHVMLINHPDRTTYNVDSDGIRRPAYKRVFHETYRGVFLQVFIQQKLLSEHPDVSSIDWTRARMLARLSATDFMLLP